MVIELSTVVQVADDLVCRHGTCQTSCVLLIYVQLLAVFTSFTPSRRRFLFLLLYRLLPYLFPLYITALLAIVPVHMPQVPLRRYHVAHPPLELLGLGEPAVHLAVPEHPALAGICCTFRSSGCKILAVVDGDDECSPRGRLQGDFAEGGGKG